MFINWGVEQEKIREISVRKSNIRQINAVKFLMLNKTRSSKFCRGALTHPTSPSHFPRGSFW
jgi:hypothetical protein